jgi:very-short-patch-repair endonuclease
MFEIIKKATRNLRRNATPAETEFWQVVRNRSIGGLKFYRQRSIQFEMDGSIRFFIADFYCEQMKLVVELDGGIHDCQKEYDKYRTFIIEQLGLQVVRFSNDEVLNDIESVIERLRKYLT